MYEYNGRINNDKTKHRALLRAVKILDLYFFLVPFMYAWFFYYSDQLTIPYYRRGNYLVLLIYIVCYYLLAHLYSGFLIHISRISELVYAQLLAAVITNFLMYLIMWLLIRFVPNPVPLLLAFAVQIIFIIAWSTFAHKWYFHYYPAKKTVIIWDEMEGLDALVSKYGLDNHYEIISKIHIKDCENKGIAKSLEGAEIVFLCSLHSHDRNQIIKYCIANDIQAYCIPRIGDAIMSGAEQMNLFHLPMLLVQRYNPKPEYLIVKRFFDIVLSGLALVILSPLMIILALVIRSDGGTAFYRQKRLTKDGKVFDILKFRSMRMDAEKDGVARLSTGEKDDRITTVGHFIRACRFDELPQLINILKGDMSIVGPRPERPEIAQQYKETLPEFDLRLQIKAGLTGAAQVYGKYNTTPYDKLLMDLMYIAKPSLAEDFKIIFATVKILFMKESTEGVADGQTNASVENKGIVEDEGARKATE